MKAHKRTIMAIKQYLEEESGDIEEVVDDIVHDVNLLHVKSMGDMTLATDECAISWDNETVCILDEFIEAYTEKLLERVCKVLVSFVGEDLEDLCD